MCGKNLCVVACSHMNKFSFSRDIGIDLGTARTRIYIPYKGIVFDEPSALAFGMNQKKEFLCIGDCAKEMLGRTPKNVEVHQTIVRGAVQDENIVEEYLINALKHSRKLFNFIKNDMLLGVPTQSTSVEQRAVIQTCKRTGARNVFTEQNTILAAFGVGTHKDELHGCMIADIGAGLTEVAVISLGGMSSSSTVKIGGNDMDVSILEYIKDRYQLNISKDVAQEVKEKIGSALSIDNSKELRVKGNDARTKLPRIIRISGNDIAEAIQPEVEAILETIADVFQRTRPELTTDIIDRGIVLTGGVAKLIGLARVIEKRINVPAHVADNPEHAVIRGIGRSIQTGHVNFHKQVLLSK